MIVSSARLCRQFSVIAIQFPKGLLYEILFVAWHILLSNNMLFPLVFPFLFAALSGLYMNMNRLHESNKLHQEEFGLILRFVCMHGQYKKKVKRFASLRI